ncbi:MAG: hypothetical protein Q4C36_00085 [Coriobacteriia bacterium]|nr:hypothetical protein [Coriobacteriia bacterium]
MGLFSPIWMTKEHSKRLKAAEAVRGITDQRKLIEVVLKAPLMSVVEVALAKLDDQHALCDLAVEASQAKEQDNRSTEIGCFAVSRIEDQELLRGIATHPRVSEPIRAAAVGRVSDQDFLRAVILDGGASDKVKSAAVRSIADPALLAQVALDHAAYGENVRRSAVARVEDPAVLAEVVRNDPSASLRMAALPRVEQGLIAEVALGEPDRNIRYKALELLTDPATLEQIARAEVDHYFRFMAFEKIEDGFLRLDIKRSWNEEQKAEDHKADLLRSAVQQDAANREAWSRRVAEGCCPHCGVPLTTPRGGIPDGAATYCSNCGNRVR